MRAASFAVDQAKWMKGYNNSEEAMNWMIDIANEAGLQVILERDNNFDLGPHYAHAFSTLGDSSMVSTASRAPWRPSRRRPSSTACRSSTI